MSKVNSTRGGCKDVYHAFLVTNARYSGNLEIPIISKQESIPEKLIAFSKALHTKDYKQWVHFYEDDVAIERVWNHPRTYLPILQKFQGVITPDFSLYRDMPLVMQAWNTYRGKALGHWWQENGISVLPNVRTGDERTYDFCFSGVSKGSVISVGSHGCMKVTKDRQYFQHGLAETVKQIQPKAIIVYGTAPADVFACCHEAGVQIIRFDSEFALSRKAVRS